MYNVYGEWVYNRYGNKRELFKMISVGQFGMIFIIGTIVLVMVMNNERFK